MSWFEKAFGRRYLELYRHRDATEADRALRSLFPDHALAGRSVLDVGCGPGRYLRVLYERGADAVGVDLSSDLLTRAREVLSPLQRSPRLVRGDMRALPFGSRRFDLTLCMFTTFGYFETRSAHAALARELARVTGAVLILDLPNPTVVERDLVAESRREISGVRAEERRWIESDPHRVCKTVRIYDLATDRLLEELEERVHLFEVDEIESYFGDVGFRVETLLGDYDGEAFDPHQSPRCLFRLRRGGPRGG